MIQNKHEKFFIPNCFLIQSEDHALNFTDAKDGIDVELMEKKNDR
jgi:hypothetical protein